MTSILRLAFAAVLSFCSYASSASGQQVRREPRQASSEQRRRIMTFVDNTDAYYKQLKDAQATEKRLRFELVEGLSTNYDRWSQAAAQVEELERLLRAEFTKVVRATEAAYRVGPNQRKGKVNGGLFDKDDATWNPQILLGDIAYSVRRPNKPPVLLIAADDPTSLAQTLNDGRTYISMEVLQRAIKNGSPAVIASTLEHEGVHYDDLIGPNGYVAKSWDQYKAYDRESAIAGVIGLEANELAEIESLKDMYRNDAVALGMGALDGQPARVPQSDQDEYPYRISPDGNVEEWKRINKRLDAIKAEQGCLNRNIAHRAKGERIESCAAEDAAPPPGTTTSDGCNATGFWAGDIYFPATPCPRALPPPPSSAPPVAARPAPPAPIATMPAPVRQVRSLSGLAERICANPSEIRAQDYHDHYKDSWIDPNEDESALPNCRREILRVLKQITRERSPDFNSDYFQALAESLNAPTSTPFVAPEPEVDYPAPYGPGVPDCLRADGRRCIRWR